MASCDKKKHTEKPTMCTVIFTYILVPKEPVAFIFSLQMADTTKLEYVAETTRNSLMNICPGFPEKVLAHACLLSQH